MKFYLLFFALASFMTSFSDRNMTEMVPIVGSGDSVLLFSFFRDEGAGTFLAVSEDGLHWKTLNDNHPVLTPMVGDQKLMRDPSVHPGIDGIYRMVWTTDWKGKSIGYAESTDLFHWSDQQLIPVAAMIDSSNNCWAPEIFYDDIKMDYLVYWSSNVGEFKQKGSEGRIYYVTTTDFKNFSAPRILFKNGFPAGGAPGNDGPIDAYIFRDDVHRFILFYKKDDNSGVPTLFFRLGETPEGPWGEESPVVKPSTGDEGPSCVKIKAEYWVFTDPFESRYAYRFSSGELSGWKREKTDLRMSHGSVIKIPKETALRLATMTTGKKP